MKLKRILVPADFSLQTRAALRYAVQMARGTGAEIDVLHVVAPPSELVVAVDAYLGRPLPHVSNDAVFHAHEQLDALLSSVDHTDVTVHQCVEAGDAAATIVRVAVENGHDLIVVGTHGRTGISELILGSVAKRLLSCAPCPVVTLRAT